MCEFPITDQNRVRRVPKRGVYDQKTIYSILDAALICHVGLIENERPVVIPTIHARDGDKILLHGASTSRLLNHVGAGHDICITVTHIDGLVLARSVFHHSMNYRSAVLFGKGELVKDADEKMKALRILTEKLIPGRWDDARQPNATEAKATHIVAVEIDTASAKVRTGPPGDDEEDYELNVWAGVLPIQTQFGGLKADPLLRNGIDVPAYLKAYSETQHDAP